MIKRTEITEAGVFNKPHGIKGEVSATLDIDIDPAMLKCIVMDVEGIYVPFFISSSRPRSAETYLLTIDGVDSEQKARELSGKEFYVFDSDLPDDDEDGEDGFYASDLIGYTMVDSDLGKIGEITDYNDSTANLLLIVTTPEEKEIFVPLAPEFIDCIDPETREVLTSLPDGIIDLNP